jgi:hypothetical protein
MCVLDDLTKILPSGTKRHLVWYIFTDVSGEGIASIFMVEVKTEQEEQAASTLLTCLLVFFYGPEDGGCTFIRKAD